MSSRFFRSNAFVSVLLSKKAQIQQIKLLNRYRFRQIARLIDIRSFNYRHIVRQ